MDIVIRITEFVAIIIEYIGFIIIATSAFIAIFNALPKFSNLDLLRKRFGERILTGLEFVIAGELLLVTITTDTRELLNIAIIVIIRAILGFVLKKEISA